MRDFNSLLQDPRENQAIADVPESARIGLATGGIWRSCRPGSIQRRTASEQRFVTARTVMTGRFDKAFVYTPIGAVEPNHQHAQWELINIFRYTGEGRLIEEWVQTDTYDFLRQLGAVGN